MYLPGPPMHSHLRTRHRPPRQAGGAPQANAVLDSAPKRIDGTDRRETLFSGPSKRNSWLSEGARGKRGDASSRRGTTAHGGVPGCLVQPGRWKHA